MPHDPTVDRTTLDRNDIWSTTLDRNDIWSKRHLIQTTIDKIMTKNLFNKTLQSHYDFFTRKLGAGLVCDLPKKYDLPLSFPLSTHTFTHFSHTPHIHTHFHSLRFSMWSTQEIWSTTIFSTLHSHFHSLFTHSHIHTHFHSLRFSMWSTQEISLTLHSHFHSHFHSHSPHYDLPLPLRFSMWSTQEISQGKSQAELDTCR